MDAFERVYHLVAMGSLLYLTVVLHGECFTPRATFRASHHPRIRMFEDLLFSPLNPSRWLSRGRNRVEGLVMLRSLPTCPFSSAVLHTPRMKKQFDDGVTRPQPSLVGRWRCSGLLLAKSEILGKLN